MSGLHGGARTDRRGRRPIADEIVQRLVWWTDHDLQRDKEVASDLTAVGGHAAPPQSQFGPAVGVRWNAQLHRTARGRSFHLSADHGLLQSDGENQPDVPAGNFTSRVRSSGKVRRCVGPLTAFRKLVVKV